MAGSPRRAKQSRLVRRTSKSTPGTWHPAHRPKSHQLVRGQNRRDVSTQHRCHVLSCAATRAWVAVELLEVSREAGGEDRSSPTW